MYSPQDIQKFFNDVRTGKYKGREPERDRIERDIFAAQRENRIQVNAWLKEFHHVLSRFPRSSQLQR